MDYDKITQDAINSLALAEEKEAELASQKGQHYEPKISHTFYIDHKGEKNNKILLKAIRQLDIEYVDESWQKADWIAVFIAGTVGAILDFLINQTKIFKPIDSFIKDVLSSPKIKNFQDLLDYKANTIHKRHNRPAPIDFQNFEMYGLKSTHEQYSFGHDPIRFIEGITQMMTGEYVGVDKFGNLIKTPFGEAINNPIHATIAYVAHMVSDMCNQQGLPYPGSTLLMQFGSDDVRKRIVAAYRNQSLNMRTFLYQSLPALFISIIIHSWAIYDNYAQTQKIKLAIGNNVKYQSMLLTSNAIVATSNITITAIRGYLGDHSALFRINWPIIANTIKHAIKYIRAENKWMTKMERSIDDMYQEVVVKPDNDDC